MKTLKTLKNILVLAALIHLWACKNVTKDSNDPKSIAEEHNEAKFDKAKEKDAQFLVDAAEIDLMEINLSQLAQQQASENEVKELGKILQKDHEKSLKEIQVLAAKKLVTIPSEITSKGKDEYNKLANKKGNDFDEAYCSAMVDGHKDAIEKFEKGSKDCEDSEIKNWANNQLPILREHLDKSMNCRDKYKDKKNGKTENDNENKNLEKKKENKKLK